MTYDTAKVGDRVFWTGLNRTYHGTVVEVADEGVIASIDGGGVMVLSTTRSIRWAEAERQRKSQEIAKPKKQSSQ